MSPNANRTITINDPINRNTGMSCDQVLNQSYEKVLIQKLERAKEIYNRRWQRLKPMFEDYLTGMTSPEICSKYEIGRTAFSQLLTEFGVPRIRQESIVHRALGKGFLLRKRDKLIQQAISNCGCAGCIWLKGRIEKTKSGLVRY